VFVLENTIGNRIRKYRNLRNLSQEELAELCSVAAPTISRWETGSLKPNRKHQLQLADILKIEISDLQKDQENEPIYSETVQDIIAILCKMDESEQELILNIILNFDQYLNR